MKIIGIKVSGIRLLTAFQMKFQNKGLTQIRGKNKQGKSTVLDCIELLLRGNKMIKADMMTHGQESATVIGQVDNWRVTRVLKVGQKPSLEIRDVETGLKKDTKPQEFLDSLINELTFNPLPWLSKSSDEKLRFISNLTGLDLTQVEAEIKKAVQDRYDAGVLLKNLGAKPDKVEKVDAVSVTDLLGKLDVEKNKAASIKIYEDRIKDYEVAKVTADEVVLELERKLKLAHTSRDQTIADINRTKNDLQKLPQPNILAAQTAFNEAEGINEKAQAYERSVTDIENWEKAEWLHKDEESHVKTARQKKDKLLRAAKMPIKGMEIKEDGLYFDGTHCENWSDSEGYEIALNVCLAMNPKLKAIFINNGNMFDPDGQKRLQEWADKHDIQIGIAIVDADVKESADGVFYIVAGEVQ